MTALANDGGGTKAGMSETGEGFNPEVNDVPTDDSTEEPVGDPTVDAEPGLEGVIDPEPAASGDHSDEPEP